MSAVTLSAATSPRRAAPPRAGRREWFGLAVLFLPTLLVAVDNTVLSFALPAISAALAPSATELLWIVDVYPLALAGLWCLGYRIALCFYLVRRNKIQAIDAEHRMPLRTSLSRGPTRSSCGSSTPACATPTCRCSTAPSRSRPRSSSGTKARA